MKQEEKKHLNRSVRFISDTMCHCAAMYDCVDMADPFCLDCGGTGITERKVSLREKLIKGSIQKRGNNNE